MTGSSSTLRRRAESRSSKGCWTCKLRRKKCDEQRPVCSRCSSVSLLCQYDPRPDWVDDEERTKQELQRVKSVVKKSAARRRAATVAAKSAAVSPSRTTSPQVTPGTTDSTVQPHERLPVVYSGFHEEDSLSRSWMWPQPGDLTESNLIMHYLDHVFYVQFKFYLPSIAHGGRGWLLSLLTSTKPLYHAALSLSAFHQQSMLCHEQRTSPHSARRLEELKHHHQLTLKELRIFIRANLEKGSSREVFEGNIQILACMVELISFELFDGGGNNWQMHLMAAANLVQTLQQHSLSSLRSPALDFLTGAIVWFDTLACVSNTSDASHPSPPHLKHYCQHLLKENGRIQLEKLMGCQNWVMTIISKIGALHAEHHIGERATEQNSHDSGMCDTKTSIHQELRAGIPGLTYRIAAIHEEYSGSPPATNKDDYNEYLIIVITTIFAHAATIYLQTSAIDTCLNTDIPSAIQASIEAFQLLPDIRMTRGLVWPLCIAGCMAEKAEDQAFFRRISEAAIGDSRTFGNSGKALEILEMAWEMRSRGFKDVKCGVAIRRLGSSVLLV